MGKVVSSQGLADASCLLFNAPDVLRLQLYNGAMLHQPRLPGTSNICAILRHFTLEWILA